MEKWKLKRTVQCAKCPWRCSTNPFEIPDGYDVNLHKGLETTIAKPGLLEEGKVLRVMACHHSEKGAEDYCVGWLHNQLGIGNNIALRLKMMYCENSNKIRVIGDQYDKFEDTLPTCGV